MLCCVALRCVVLCCVHWVRPSTDTVGASSSQSYRVLLVCQLRLHVLMRACMWLAVSKMIVNPLMRVKPFLALIWDCTDACMFFKVCMTPTETIVWSYSGRSPGPWAYCRAPTQACAFFVQAEPHFHLVFLQASVAYRFVWHVHKWQYVLCMSRSSKATGPIRLDTLSLLIHKRLLLSLQG